MFLQWAAAYSSYIKAFLKKRDRGIRFIPRIVQCSSCPQMPLFCCRVSLSCFWKCLKSFRKLPASGIFFSFSFFSARKVFSQQQVRGQKIKGRWSLGTEVEWCALEHIILSINPQIIIKCSTNVSGAWLYTATGHKTVLTYISLKPLRQYFPFRSFLTFWLRKQVTCSLRGRLVTRGDAVM